MSAATDTMSATTDTISAATNTISPTTKINDLGKGGRGLPLPHRRDATKAANKKEEDHEEKSQLEKAGEMIEALKRGLRELLKTEESTKDMKPELAEAVEDSERSKSEPKEDIAARHKAVHGANPIQVAEDASALHDHSDHDDQVEEFRENMEKLSIARDVTPSGDRK